MGLFDVLANMLKIKKEQINILVVGLNNSGKSTIVNHFKDPEERSSVTLPTVGFSVEKFQSEFIQYKIRQFQWKSKKYDMRTDKYSSLDFC